MNFLRSLLSKYRIFKLRSFYQIGKSHLFEDFKLILYKPKKNKKYLNIGDDTILNCSMIFESEEGIVSIGNRCYIGNSTIICRSGVQFGDDIFVAWGCYFYDHNSHSLDYRTRQQDIKDQLNDYRLGKLFIENKNWDVVETKPITICSNSWIGMNSIILKGVTIGEGAIVGAGSVVTKDVEPWTVVAGNPAVVVKVLPDELRKDK